MPTVTRNGFLAAIFVATLQVFAPPPAAGHEFWLEPSNYAPKTGAKVAIRIRNGMFFKGNSLPYINAWLRKFEIKDSRGVRPVDGIEGDDPAALVTFVKSGLAIASFYGTPDVLKFEKWEKFESYLKDEGLERLLARHSQRGLPQTGIEEKYSRCAKALLAVGDGKGEDQATGMPLELIALRNPYQLPAGAPLPVRLIYKGKPLGGVLIKVFNRMDPKQPQRYVTGPDGKAVIPLPLKGAYMLNAVHMFDPPPGVKEHWDSLWASLTFSRK